MTLPESQNIRALIATPCLIKTDRAGRAFFISDFNRRTDTPRPICEKLESAGYICSEAGGMTLIDWPPERYAAWYLALPDIPLPAVSNENAPLWGLRRILSQHPASIEAQDMRVLSQALRWARLNETDKLIRLIRTAFAEALRKRETPPYHTAKLLSALIHGQPELYYRR